MGKHGPRKGSRAFWHRKRAPRLSGRIRAWNTTGKAGLTGIVGYKAGMTHVLMIEDADSPLKNQEVTRAVTIVEVPPILVYAITAYKNTVDGLKKVAEIPVTQGMPKEAKRMLTVAKKSAMKADDLDAMELADVRVMCISMPWKAQLKKTPEVVEIAIAGKDVAEKLKYAKSALGKEVKAADVFAEGDYADIIAVTKGKGWQGMVKRFGVALNPMKATQSRRHGGSLGGETQAKIMYTIPRPGQTGYQRRTEFNKRVMRISEAAKAAQATPLGGFLKYGTMNADFIIFEGSLGGPAKRALTIRRSIRDRKSQKPTILQVSLESKMG